MQRDSLAFALLLFSALITVWLGVGGALLNEVQARSLYEILKDWQTLFTGVLALGAAYVAVKPVWKQVSLQAAQTAGEIRNHVHQDFEDYQYDVAEFYAFRQNMHNAIKRLAQSLQLSPETMLDHHARLIRTNIIDIRDLIVKFSDTTNTERLVYRPSLPRPIRDERERLLYRLAAMQKLLVENGRDLRNAEVGGRIDWDSVIGRLKQTLTEHADQITQIINFEWERAIRELKETQLRVDRIRILVESV